MATTVAMSCKKHIVLFSVDTTGEIGDQLGSDETDIAALTWQVLDVARNQVRANQNALALKKENCIERIVKGMLAFSHCQPFPSKILRRKLVHIWCPDTSTLSV